MDAHGYALVDGYWYCASGLLTFGHWSDVWLVAARKVYPDAPLLMRMTEEGES
jgi:hypothetical protein